MGRNLGPLNIQDTYEGLVQISGSQLTDGTGSLIENLDITASNATTATSASHAVNADSAINANFATSASYATFASGAVDVNAIYTASAAGTTITFEKGDTSTFDVSIAVPSFDTGSLLTTASISDATLTFTKGDGSTFDTIVNNVVNATSASYATQADNATTADTATSASHAINADSATSSSYALTASYAENVTTPSLQQVTDVGASTTNAITASGAFLNGDVSISGDLDVNGTITYISSSTLQIGDNIIEINYNKTAGNSGMIVYDTTSPFTASMLWDASADRWIAGPFGSEKTIILSSDTGSMAVATAVSASHAVQADNATTATSASHAVQADSATQVQVANQDTNAEYNVVFTGLAASGNPSDLYRDNDDLFTFNAFTETLKVPNIIGTASLATTAVSASHAVNADSAISASHTINADSAISASHSVNADSAISASHALNADNAISASYAPSSPAFPHTGSMFATASAAGDAVNLDYNRIYGGNLTRLNPFQGVFFAQYGTLTTGSGFVNGGAMAVGTATLNGAYNNFVAGGDGLSTGGNNTAVIGGANNAANVDQAVVAGGNGNSIDAGSRHFIGAGNANAIDSSGDGAIIGASEGYISSFAIRSAVVGGEQNQVHQQRSVVLGGFNNRVDVDSTSVGDSAVIAGTNNRCNDFSGSVVLGGNGIIADAHHTVFVPNLHLTGSTGGTLTFADGTTMTTAAGGGSVDTGSFYVSSSVVNDTITFNQGDGTTESVTINNVVNATSASYAVSASYAPASDPFPYTGNPLITGDLAVNGDIIISGSNRLLGEGTSLSIGHGSPAFTLATNMVAVGGINTTVGSSTNLRYGFIAGGGNNNVGNTNATMGQFVALGGNGNSMNGADDAFFIGGGSNNVQTNADRGGILGGTSNTANHARSVVIGGTSLSTSKADEVVVQNLSTYGAVVQDVNAISIASNTGSLDASLGNMFTMTLQNGVDTHLELSNQSAGQTIQLKLTNNATSAGTISFDSQFEFEGGTPFTATAATNAVDILTFTCFDGGNVQLVGFKNFS